MLLRGLILRLGIRPPALSVLISVSIIIFVTTIFYLTLFPFSFILLLLLDSPLLMDLNFLGSSESVAKRVALDQYPDYSRSLHYPGILGRWRRWHKNGINSVSLLEKDLNSLGYSLVIVPNSHYEGLPE